MCDERKPHKHADVIKAWADGAVIQNYNSLVKAWVDIINNPPTWGESIQYRIKPQPTDLEKYGVEEGDVWKTDTGVLLIGKKEGAYWFSYIRQRLVLICSKDKLLFRRGVVNKL